MDSTAQYRLRPDAVESEDSVNAWDPTHCLEVNGSSINEISPLLGAERVVRRAPTLLDGRSQFAISLWRLPEGKRLWDERPGGWPVHFVQAAGSAERMMIEVALDDVSGDWHLYRLGHAESGEGEIEVAEIEWGERTDHVAANEMFDATEAGDIFWHYYENGNVPSKFQLNEIE